MPVKHRDWPPERRFPDLDAPWFRANHAPPRAFDKWSGFLETGPHDDSALFRHALEYCSGKSAAAVAVFLRLMRDPLAYDGKHIGEKTRKRFAEIAAALGWSPAPPAKIWSKPSRRILLFTDLTSAANPRFHMEALESILLAAAAPDGAASKPAQFFVAIQSIHSRGPGSEQAVARALVRIDPDAAIWFRMTPSDSELAAVRRCSKIMPVVVIHGDRLYYPDPVVAHVIPNHERVDAAVENWARRVFPVRNSNTTVVVAAMPPDAQPPEYPPTQRHGPICLRQERVEKVKDGLRKAGVSGIVHQVPNYTAGEAFDVLQSYSGAAGFVCLSDDLAVAMKQLLLAGGIRTSRPILGFDGSDLARRHGIDSLNQHVRRIGVLSIREIFSAVRYLRENEGRLPGFHEIGIPVE